MTSQTARVTQPSQFQQPGFFSLQKVEVPLIGNVAKDRLFVGLSVVSAATTAALVALKVLSFTSTAALITGLAMGVFAGMAVAFYLQMPAATPLIITAVPAGRQPAVAPSSATCTRRTLNNLDPLAEAAAAEGYVAANGASHEDADGAPETLEARQESAARRMRLGDQARLAFEATLEEPTQALVQGSSAGAAEEEDRESFASADTSEAVQSSPVQRASTSSPGTTPGSAFDRIRQMGSALFHFDTTNEESDAATPAPTASAIKKDNDHLEELD